MSAVLKSVVCFVCVFYGLLRLHLLSMPCLLYLRPQFYHFRCKLHGITMTYYIGHRKADNFKIFTSSVVCLLSIPYLLRLHLLCLGYLLYLRFLWLTLSASSVSSFLL